jgi:hypothetical protein
MDLLGWTADPPGGASARNLRALRVLVVAHWAVEWASRAIVPLPPPADLPRALTTGVACALVALCALTFTRHARLACLLALPLALLGCVSVFPLLPNHTALAAMLLALLALLEPEAEEGELLLQSLRWMTVLVFVWAGVQKALNGLYFRAEFLTWMIAHGPSAWRGFFGTFVPADEIARVAALPRFGIDLGPYRIASLPLVLASNGAWLGEILLGLGLLWQRVRPAAVVGALALVFLIQAAPHEWMFALLYAQLLLLFLSGPWLARSLPGFLLIDVYLLAALAGAPGSSLLIKASGHL